MNIPSSILCSESPVPSLLESPVRKRFTTTLLSLALTASFVAEDLALQAGKPASRSAETDLGTRDAQNALSREDWPAAIRGYERLVKLSPDRADFFLNLGIAYYSAGQPFEAVPALRQASKLKSDLTAARDYLGASLAQVGQCREALPLLKKSISRITDQHLKRVVGLGGVRCSMSVGQADEAIDFIRRLNRDLPNDPEILYLSVHVYSDLSMKASQDLLFKAPASYQVHLLNAEALETQERWDDAAYEYRQVLAKNPALPGIHYRLGRLLLSAPKKPTTTEDARREFEEELKIDPRNAGAEYVLGELARQARQWPQAIEHFSRVSKLNPTFADAFIGLGKSLVSAGRPEEAVKPLETAVRLQPENPVAHFQLATAYRRAGRKDEAEREFAAHRKTSEQARQRTEGIQNAVLGPPQTAEPPD
jgi:tetratricopeptide (TPR) repeat protein